MQGTQVEVKEIAKEFEAIKLKGKSKKRSCKLK